jgi:hypothetical protein
MQPTRPPAPSAQADRDRSPRVAARTGAFACVLSRTRARGRGSVVMKKGDFKDSPVTGMPRHATRSSVPPHRRATAPMYRRDATRAHSFARTRPGCSARLRAQPMRAAACLPRRPAGSDLRRRVPACAQEAAREELGAATDSQPCPAAPRRPALRCNAACVATQRALQRSVRCNAACVATQRALQHSVRCNTACGATQRAVQHSVRCNTACVATQRALATQREVQPTLGFLARHSPFGIGSAHPSVLLLCADRSQRPIRFGPLRCAAQVTFEPFQCVPLDIRAPTLESIDHVPPSGRTRTRTRTRIHDSTGTWRARRHGLALACAPPRMSAHRHCRQPRKTDGAGKLAHTCTSTDRAAAGRLFGGVCVCLCCYL